MCKDMDYIKHVLDVQSELTTTIEHLVDPSKNDHIEYLLDKIQYFESMHGLSGEGLEFLTNLKDAMAGETDQAINEILRKAQFLNKVMVSNILAFLKAHKSRH